MSDQGIKKLFKIKRVYGNKYFLNILTQSILTRLNSKRDWHFNDSRKVIEHLYPFFVQRNKQLCQFKIPLNNVDFKVSMRLKTSDFAVYSQIFIENEYRLIIDFFKRFKSENPVMIDLGGNIGLASLNFASQFSNTHLILLEPNKENIEMCKNNLSCFENVEILNKAIYNKNTTLYEDYSFRLGMHSSFRYTEEKTSNPSIEAVSIESLLSVHHEVDFLKIDVEGAEKEIFETNLQTWLHKVKVIAVEIHDDIVSRTPIQSALRTNGFILCKYGEYTIGINKKFYAEQSVIEFLDGY